MKKSIFLVLALISLGAWYYITDGEMTLDAAKKGIRNAALDTVAHSVKPEDVAALALKTIEFKQGENGIELWRLKADWGNMRRNGETMELEKPRFTYYMPPDNNEVAITSNKGDLNQEKQVIQFFENVVSTFDERTLLSSRMIYEGKGRVMTFPEGAALEGKDVAGTAAHVVWRLGDRIIDASGGVDVTFHSERNFLPSRLSSGTKQVAQPPTKQPLAPAQPQPGA